MSRYLIETLADIRDSGYTLWAHCLARDSGHGAPLDIHRLIGRFGETHVFVGDDRIDRACVCRRCGHRGAALRLHGPTAPKRAGEG